MLYRSNKTVTGIMLPDNDVCTRIVLLVNLTLIVIVEQGLQTAHCTLHGRSDARVNISGVSHSPGQPDKSDG